MIFNIYAHIVTRIPCRHFVLCKVASKTKHFIHADILVLVSELVVVVILSEWLLFYLSGGRCRPLPTNVGTSLLYTQLLSFAWARSKKKLHCIFHTTASVLYGKYKIVVCSLEVSII